MPSKSVREMNQAERRHNSLAARSFHAILLLSLMLGIAAVAFGFTLYANATKLLYENKMSDAALTAALTVDRENVARLTERVLERWAQDPETAAARCEELKDEDYEKAADFLRTIRYGNRLTTSAIGIPDASGEHFVFVVNANPVEKTLEPGQSVPMDRARLSALEPVNGRPAAMFLRQANGELACIAAAPVADEAGGTVGYVICGVLLTDVMKGSAGALWQYVLLLTALAALFAFFALRHMKKTVVEPVNRIASAAEACIADRQAGKRDQEHFHDLSIQTGDEVENLSLLLADMEDELDRYEEDLTRITSEKERIGAELDLAGQIQEGMLPSIFPPFPGRSEFDIYASMHPAKELGGDFYDFFLLDDDHLAIVMSDASGKGVPAALFMMASKILLNNYALLNVESPAKVLERVNHQICLNNKAEMFVTTWFGILEISTGRLRAANAGHEYPAFQKAGGGFELFRDKHSFVLGGMDGVRYKEYEVRLAPGDALFLYTDGVTEAADAENTLFGEDRMIDALNLDPTAGPEKLIDTVKAKIDEFVGDAPQFDDMTMLCLRYRGNNTKKLRLDATVENLPRVLAFIDKVLEAADCPVKTQMQIDVAVEEIFVNIASYAYAPDTGKAIIGIDVDEESRCARISFSDTGMPYNPLERETPDISLPAEKREIGGLGIHMVRKIMDSVEYEYRNGQNRLFLTKSFES